MTSRRRPVGEGARALPPRRVRQAVILVDGEGSGLRKPTREAPKPLMKISADRVFLDLLIDNVARQGFDQILLLAGHFGEQIADRYEGRVILGATLSVAVEPEPKGAGGALRWACDKLDLVFLGVDGDTYFEFPIAPSRLSCTTRLTRSRSWLCAMLTMQRVMAPSKRGARGF